MLHRLMVAPTRHFGIQLVRYGAVAVGAQVVDFGLLYVFTHYFHLFYLVSAMLSFTISLVANYALSSLWVFTKQSSYKRSIELTIFAIVAAVGLGLTLLIVGFCTSVLGIFYLKSKLIAITIVFFWSFLARRHLVFRKQTLDELELS